MQFKTTITEDHVRAVVRASETLSQEITLLGTTVAAKDPLGALVGTLRAQHVALTQTVELLFEAVRNRNEGTEAGFYIDAVERLKADLAFHQDAYGREDTDEIAESYHAGRVNALSDALNLLAGREVKLYSETA